MCGCAICVVVAERGGFRAGCVLVRPSVSFAVQYSTALGILAPHARTPGVRRVSSVACVWGERRNERTLRVPRDDASATARTAERAATLRRRARFAASLRTALLDTRDLPCGHRYRTCVWDMRSVLWSRARLAHVSISRMSVGPRGHIERNLHITQQLINWV